jgi:hypothetical protein
MDKKVVFSNLSVQYKGNLKSANQHRKLMEKVVISLFVWLLILLQNAATQQILNKESSRLLDSALFSLNMSRADLWIPADAVTEDLHRLKSIKELFGIYSIQDRWIPCRRTWV